ncbi:hypothetical protein D3C80_1156060 [compost metagenome]
MEIKAGSHRHPWNELDNVPAQATRWPSWGEVTDKPALAAQEHAHNYLTLRNLDWNTQTDAFMTGSAQAPKGSGSSEFLSWISWGHNGGSKYRHTLFSPTSAIRQLWYGFKANTSDTTSPSTNARIYHTYDKPTPAEIGAAAASHSHSWGQISGIPAYATRWPSWAEVTGKPATMPPSAHTHTAAQGNADIVNSGYGQVGTYALLMNLNWDKRAPGTVLAGSALRYASCMGFQQHSGIAPAGSWKLCGWTAGKNNEGAEVSLWIRIA